MRNFFNMDNPVWSFIGKLLDVIVLHVFWVVCCLPVVTFGASTTALYDVMMRLADDRGTHQYRRFFIAFKQNLRQGIIMGLLFLASEAGLVYSYLFCTKNIELNPVFEGIRVVAIILIVLIFIIFEYAFPILARFENTIYRTIVNGFLMSLRHFGWTIVLTAIPVAFYALVIYFAQFVFPLLILGFGLIAFIQAFIFNRIFKPFVEEFEKPVENEEDT